MDGWRDLESWDFYFILFNYLIKPCVTSRQLEIHCNVVWCMNNFEKASVKPLSSLLKQRRSSWTWTCQDLIREKHHHQNKNNPSWRGLVWYTRRYSTLISLKFEEQQSSAELFLPVRAAPHQICPQNLWLSLFSSLNKSAQAAKMEGKIPWEIAPGVGQKCEIQTLSSATSPPQHWLHKGRTSHSRLEIPMQVESSTSERC